MSYLNRIVVVFILIIINTACSSVPFTSMVKLASLDNNALLKISPKLINVRITLDDPAQLAIKDVQLVLRFDYGQSREEEYRFNLNMLEKTQLMEKQWFSDTQKRHQYTFKLDDSSIKAFKKYQREFIKIGKPEKYYWTVYYHLINKQDIQKVNLDLA